LQFNGKEELYQQVIRCDVIIYHIVDDSVEIDEAVWVVSRMLTDLLICMLSCLLLTVSD